MDYVPDYTDLYEEYEAELDRQAEKLPECAYCGVRITDDYYYDIDGTILCEDCMNDEYRKNTDEYMED